jgi:hypothetical protein
MVSEAKMKHIDWPESIAPEHVAALRNLETIGLLATDSDDVELIGAGECVSEALSLLRAALCGVERARGRAEVRQACRAAGLPRVACSASAEVAP